MFLQLLVSGISMGFIYALVGIEYTLIWNSCKLLNFAHGHLMMIGAYLFGGTFVVGLGVSYIMGWVGSIAVMIILSVILSFIIFIPLKDVGRLYAIIATLLFGFVVNELVTLIWGIYPYNLPNYLGGVFRFGKVILTKIYAFSIVVSVIVVIALLCFMKFSKTGKAMRCVSENKPMAAMVGIDVKKNMIITISISCVICAIVGMLIAPMFSISMTMSNTVATKGFVSAVLGGFGSVPGAILGGIIVGAVENIATMKIDAVYKDVVSFVLLIVIILVKPSGILGSSKTKMSAKPTAKEGGREK